MTQGKKSTSKSRFKYERFSLNFKAALLLFLLLCPQAQAMGKKKLSPGEPSCALKKTSTTLKVLTYNIQALPKPILRGPKLRFKKIIQYLSAYNYDIVMIQEAFSKSVIKLFKEESRFPFKHFGNYSDMFPVITNKTGDGLITLSKLPIVLKENITFKKNRCSGFDCMSKKGALLTRIKLNDGAELDVMNTHFQSGSGDKITSFRKSQAMELGDFKRFMNVGNPFISGGDYNSSPYKEEYPIIRRELNAYDAWADFIGNTKRPPRDTEGYTLSNENYFKRKQPDSKNKRIDYVFYNDGLNSKIIVEHAKVAFKNETFDGEKQLSDHFGVESTIRIDSEPCR